MTRTIVSLRNPVTGEAIEPIGYRANGAPIFPLMGGSGEDDEDDGADDAEDSDDGQDDDPDEEDDSDTDTSSDADTDKGESKDKPWDEKTARAEARKKNNENKNLRERLKKAEADAQAWRDHQKSQLSKEDQLKADLDEKESNTKGLARENALLRVRLETGLSERQVKRLAGDDYESLLEDAKEFIEDNPGAVKETPARRTPPARNLKGGSSQSSDDDNELDPAKLAARIKRGY